MHEVTNRGDTVRVFHDAFGQMQVIKSGETIPIELAASVVEIIENAQGRGEPLRIRKLDDGDIGNPVLLPLSNEPPPIPQPPLMEIISQLSDLSYHELVGHARRLMGESYDLGVHPKKQVVQQRLRELAASVA